MPARYNTPKQRKILSLKKKLIKVFEFEQNRNLKTILADEGLSYDVYRKWLSTDPTWKARVLETDYYRYHKCQYQKFPFMY
ncbi:MAG: hypothetical protein OYG31_02705 [Candidatus Kaiserbacteria bacterium]|nr:hypothetical protein [Candidatus Kaiserbacteria bacterium]MDE0243596.1 hypothetical protein [Candidatus Kaiserbacteria bacterium]